MTSPHRYIPVAEISRPHGIRGELRLRLFNKDSDLLRRMAAVQLRLTQGDVVQTTIRGVRSANKALLVCLDGVEDRDAAEALRGALVCVDREAFPPLEEGEFYLCDLEGADVITTSGEHVGKVQTVQTYPTCDALVVARPNQTTMEIPLSDTYVARIDAMQGVVELITLDGLS